MPWTDKINTVWQGDCMDLMREMPDKCIDVIITDPPYGLPKEDFNLVKKAIKEMWRISKMQIIILDWRNPLGISSGKFAELIWEYGWISGGRTKSTHFYPTHNTIHFLGEDLFDFDTKDGSIIYRRPGFSSPRQTSYAKKSGHPHEKPIKLLEYLIKRSYGKIVFDPFMGSWTTARACKDLGRDFIGAELSKEYCE